ncbi:hypothetical protein GGR52DRAFT_97695 [Hypoxylon sp. FL1284]|nr:hypothetical protein GGR52DRAFT_97695 [Hypoxylon sp. FL1284]
MSFVPPGNLNTGNVTSNVPSSPTITHSTLLGFQWSGTGFSILVVAARLAIRLKTFRRLQIDDYLITTGAILNIAWCVLWTIIGNDLYASSHSDPAPTSSQHGANNSHNKESQHRMLANYILASYIVMWSCLWAVKSSFMAFFYGLRNRVRSQRILWWIVLVLIVASYIACIAMLNYQCQGNKASDSAKYCLSRGVLDQERRWSILKTTMDIVTDVSIVILSGNIVWRAQIPLKRKAVLTFFCSLTVFMVVIAVVRVVGTGDITRLQLWNSIEMTTAIFVACFASFRSLYSRSRSSRQDKEPTVSASDRAPAREHILVQSTFSMDVTSSEHPLWDRQPSTESQDVLWAEQKVPGTSTYISS